MTIRFTTQAANADVLGDDAPVGKQGSRTTRDGEPASPQPYERSRETSSNRTVGKPGEDINAAGFIRSSEDRE